MPGTAENESGSGGGYYGGGGDLESGVATPETDGARLARMGTDGVVWARELAEALNGAGYNDGTADIDPTPGGLLHVWMCNAIEAGRSAGYSAGRRDAAAAAAELAECLEGMEGYGGEVDGREYAAGLIRSRLVSGWPVPLPADSSGSDLAADSAGSELPANLAGSDLLARIAEALERIAATVAPGDTDGHGGWAAPYVRVATP